MDWGKMRQGIRFFFIPLCLMLMVSAPQNAGAFPSREDSCGPGEHKDRVSGPAIVGQLTLTDRGVTGTFSYLDVEFISKSASCSGEKLIITSDNPLYSVKWVPIGQIVEKCLNPLDICLEGAVFYYNYTDGPISNPEPPPCAPSGWDQVVVSTVLAMDKPTGTLYDTLVADVVLLWFNPACE